MNFIFPLLAWYLLLGILGAFAFPLAFAAFPALKGRGFAFTRVFGLLLWAFVFWLLSSLGVLENDAGGIFLALALVAALAVWAWQKNSQAIKDWWVENKHLVLTVEVLFLVAFVTYALFRALAPEITDTEKPMELAFINAILRSDRMPPLDPWLSGYSISYYYFGYLMVAMLAKLTGLNAGFAFNLGVATIFAATAVGAYGIVYNLLAEQFKKQRRNLYLALLAPLFVLIVSNGEGFLEFVHERGVFWQMDANGQLVSDFWKHSIDIKDLENPPNLESQGRRHWWWWRASRVLRDYSYPTQQDIAPADTPDGLTWFRGDAVAEQEVIDEFPAFSYYLADLHSHVLAMPFAFLALAFALNHFLDPKDQGFNILGYRFHIAIWRLLLGALVFGGLAFLNTWDLPLYLGLFACIHTLKRARQEGWAWTRLGDFLVAGFTLGIGSILLYLPFYLGFSSQAGGILPNLINPTRGVQLWVMFGTLLLPLLALLLYINYRRGWKSLMQGILAAMTIALGLLTFSTLLAWLAVVALPKLAALNPLAASAGDMLLGMYGGHSLADVLREGFSRRLASPGGLLTLLAVIGLALAGLWPQPEDANETQPVNTFALLLTLLGALLVLAPDFVYLRDQFGTRMNTIFKFYMQAWLLWAVVAAYASSILFASLKRPLLLTIFTLVFTIAVGASLFYPAYAVATDIHEFRSKENAVLQLDGTVHNRYLNNDDQAAVAWLVQAPLGTLVEAVGGSYTHYARISAHSGQPALLGWPGHESQWRGGAEEMGSRQADIQRLYTTPSWSEAETILWQYDIRYIYVGQLEMMTYDVSLAKFEEHLPLAFRQGDVSIYQVPAFSQNQSFE